MHAIAAAGLAPFAWLAFRHRWWPAGVALLTGLAYHLCPTPFLRRVDVVSSVALVVLVAAAAPAARPAAAAVGVAYLLMVDMEWSPCSSAMHVLAVQWPLAATAWWLLERRSAGRSSAPPAS